jgi:hypothetical protein
VALAPMGGDRTPLCVEVDHYPGPRQALAGAGALAVVVLVSAPWHLTNWILTHWTFRYGDGLRGRALVGSSSAGRRRNRSRGGPSC